MKKFIENRWILILIPLGGFIYFIDNKLTNGLLNDNKFSDHLFLVGTLIIVVSILLAIVVNIDKKSQECNGILKIGG